MSKNTANVVIILDKSGSMESTRDATISAFNEQIETIREMTESVDVTLSLVTFNHVACVNAWRADPAAFEPLSRETYRPGGNTAMYDAVGKAVDKFAFDEWLSKKETYLFIIISDGVENSSQRYTAAMLADRITRLQATDRWTFSYIGANQNLAEVSDRMGIPRSNMAAYENTAAGTRRMGSMASEALRRYLRRAANGMASSLNFMGEGEALELGEPSLAAAL